MQQSFISSDAKRYSFGHCVSQQTACIRLLGEYLDYLSLQGVGVRGCVGGGGAAQCGGMKNPLET